MTAFNSRLRNDFEIFAPTRDTHVCVQIFLNLALN